MTPTDPPSRLRKLPLLFILVGLLLLFLWLGLKGWRIYQAAASLQAREAAARQLAAGGLAGLDANAAEALVMGVRGDVLTLQQETRIFMPLLPYLGWVPRLGPTLAAAPHLMEMADAGTSAAAYAFRGLKPGLSGLQDANGAALSLLTQTLAQAAPDLGQAAADVDRVAAAYAQIENREALPWQLRQFFPQLDEWLPVAQAGLRLSQVLPSLLGSNGPRTYLVVAQNEDELRPTGGFISGVGLLTLHNGQIVALQFNDANLVDDWANKPYDWPPDPLYQFMGSELFLFRDANFWPDFPTSATAMMDLYTYGQGVALDGVIATDQQFLQMLLTALGPVTLPDLAVTVSGDMVLDWIRTAWAPPPDTENLREWMLSRKSFMGPLAAAIQTRLLQNPGEVDFVTLARTLMQAVETKHLSIYVRDPSVAAILAELGWDGRLFAAPGQDTLWVVDANLGFNKVNALVDTAFRYAVTLTPAGTGEAALAVTYTHRGAPRDKACIHQTVYTAETTYEQLVNDCYWNYVRVYAPAAAQLQSASSQPVPAANFVTQRPWDGVVQTLEDPSGLTTFVNFLLLPPGETATHEYSYQLPAVTTPSADGGQTYRLQWRKQPGTRPQPVQVLVTLPAGAQIVSIVPAAAQVNGATITFDLSLTADLDISVTYR